MLMTHFFAWFATARTNQSLELIDFACLLLKSFSLAE